MKRIIFGLAAAVLGLAMTTTAAEAHSHGAGGHGFRGHGYQGHFARYSSYRSHWGPRTWSPSYNRYVYWDSYLNCYFYYDAGCGQYVRCP